METILTSRNWLQSKPIIKESIWNLIKEWESVLGMAHWTWTLTFREEKYLASTEAEPAYYRAKFHYNYSRVEREVHNDFDLAELVVHEMCHCKSWPLSEMAERLIKHSGDTTGELDAQRELHDEQMTTTFGQALVMVKYGLTELPEGIRLRTWDDKAYIGVEKPLGVE